MICQEKKLDFFSIILKKLLNNFRLFFILLYMKHIKTIPNIDPDLFKYISLIVNKRTSANKINLLAIFLQELINRQTVLLTNHQRQYPYKISDSFIIYHYDSKWIQKTIKKNKIGFIEIGDGTKIPYRTEYVRKGTLIHLNPQWYARFLKAYKNKKILDRSLYGYKWKHPVYYTNFYKNKIPLSSDLSLYKQMVKFNRDHLRINGLTYVRHFGRDTTQYGRFYNRFQNYSKFLRKEVMDNLNLSEVDFSAFNIQLAYLLVNGKKFNGDCYNVILNELGNPDYLSRNDIKPMVLSMFCCSNYNQTLQSIQNQIYQNKLYLHGNIKASNIISAIEKCHKSISTYFYSSFAKIAQNIESNVIFQVSKILLKLNITHYLIHDCILVDNNYHNFTDNLMESYLLFEVYNYKSKYLKSKKIKKIKDEILKYKK